MKFLRRLLRFIGKLILWFFALTIGFTVLFKFVPVPFTPLMLIRLWEQTTDSEKEIKLQKKWVSITEISKHMPQAVVAAEDQIFLKHSGFDWKAMENAWENNKKGKRVKGASTITQQTAKNVFLWPGRNLIRKGLEAYFTFLIELFWSKERIIEVYLNIIEMGEGIYGVEAAAQANFNKTAAELTRGEAALIAAVLPNPRRWTPARPTAYISGRQSWILRQMGNLEPVGFGK